MCISQPCNSYELRDPSDRKRTYRDLIGDVAKRDGDDKKLVPEVIEAEEKGDNEVRRATNVPSAGGTDVASLSWMGRGRVARPQGRQGKREGDGREVVIDKHMEGIDKDVRTMGSAITTIMNNQRIYHQRDDEINLLVMLPKGISKEDLIRQHMISQRDRESKADIAGRSMVTSCASMQLLAAEDVVDVSDGDEIKDTSDDVGGDFVDKPMSTSLKREGGSGGNVIGSNKKAWKGAARSVGDEESTEGPIDVDEVLMQGGNDMKPSM